MKQKRGASPAASKKAGGEKRTNSNAGIAARGSHLKLTELQRDHEIRVSVNAGKPKRICQIAYAEIKGCTCECVMLRAVRMGNQQGCPERGEPSTTARLERRA